MSIFINRLNSYVFGDSNDIQIEWKKRRWIIQQLKKNKLVNEIALAQKVHRKTVWEIKKKYKQWGDDGLKDHKPGRLFEPLSPKFYNLVICEWKKTRYGSRKLKVHFDKKGHGVSLRKISQVMVKEGFQKPCKERQKPRKYKRYEWPIPDIMWHTDWHIIKAKKLKGKANHAFQEALKELGIRFIPSRKRHPQTNGKLEKFHHILDTEFDERFETIDEFIEWYNNERISEAVDYMTPNEAYNKRL